MFEINIGKYKIKEVTIPETRYKIIDTETGEDRLVKRDVSLSEIEKQICDLTNES